MTEPATPEAPWPVRTVARKISGWIDRLGAVWVEGQLTQINARPGTGTAFLTLRDPAVARAPAPIRRFGRPDMP